MCDQTEVTYSPSDVVWVKLGPVWWPGQVQDYEKLPEEITSNLRKKPIAVVKFFQEETFEYVKNLNQIYHYNCRKKEEFIKKGLDMVRSSNSRDVPSNMKMFPNDIVMAEHITGGDPNILESEAFAPEQKSNYSDLFGTKKSSGKKSKGDSLKRESDDFKSRKGNDSPIRNGRRSLPNLPSSIPRPITHPRFITKALEGRSDHEVRIRCQLSARRNDDEENSPTEKKYKCHLCEFQSARLNVIVLHNKSHSASFIEAQNANKARLKSREKELLSPPLNIPNEQTPTTVTSRGRVKSLPKKLMDYMEEPPLKVFKEKIPNKPVSKEETDEARDKITIEKSPNKTPKKQRDSCEKLFIKRPLFGKRKTAKEKAELAAKQKLENEAMKETLLKDWDDDDVNQEEVELERLKQALESTTSSTEADNNITVNESEILRDMTDTSTAKVKEKLIETDLPKIETKSDIKSKVFEFDDSEDSLPVNINFRLKSQREKFTDDKFKKPKPPKPLSRVSAKSKIVTTSLPSPSKKEEDKETAEFNEACNALLEETVVPVLPEIPKIGLNTSTSSGIISDQTSDISSSTDLMEMSDGMEIGSEENHRDPVNSRRDSETICGDLKMECTSSDSEELKLTESVVLDHTEQSEMREDQKNLKDVLASKANVETGIELLSSGVAITTSEDLKTSFETIIGKDSSEMCEDTTATEISSTCDETNSYRDESKIQTHVTDDKSSEQPEASNISPFPEINHACVNDLSMNAEEPEDDKGVKTDHPETFKLNSANSPAGIDQVQEVFKDATISSLQNENSSVMKTDQNVVESNQSVDNTHLQQLNITTENMSPETDFLPVTNKVAEESETAKEENGHLSEQTDIKEEVIQPNIVEAEENLSSQLAKSESQLIASSGNIMNVQLLLPVDSEHQKTSSVQITSQQQPPDESMQTVVPKLEDSDSARVDHQNLTQNLQDMELDINSMPVIIGGEDFMQTEQPKPNLVPIQPKYSESIVISPKASTSSPSKTESVIMHLGEPSTSNQSLQSVISIPSKGGRGGGRGGKVQKATSKTIKLSASALKNLGTLQKGGNQQVIILKTATSSGQDNQDKSTIQKTKGPLNMFQHGNKILIVNNPQISGQNKIKLNPQQQQLLTGGKLAPGTRVFTSKVVATTTSQGVASASKTSTSRASSKPTQKLVISKGGLLTNTSKGVIINNSTGKLMTTVPGTHAITTSKGQTLITHNILSTKGGLILPSSTQNASSGSKTSTIITSQALSTSKGMILAPITSKGGTIISGNQKLRIVSSKAPLSGTRLVVQNPQGKMSIDPQQKGQQVKLISGLRGQPSGNAILIQTSQGLLAKSIASSTTTTAVQPTIRATSMAKTVMTTIPTQTKIRVSTSSTHQPQVVQQPQTVQQPQIVQQTQLIHQPQIVQQAQTAQQPPQAVQSNPSVKKVGAQKVRQSPNILQKTQRKSTPRASKTSGNRLISPAVPVSESIILSTTSSLPVISQPTLVQGQVPQSSDGLVYLTVDESGNYRQLDNKSLITFESSTGETPRTIFIPSDGRAQDVGNLFLAIDEAGNIVNITQPAPSKPYTTENTAPSQDILAKALANTQVLQQETIIPDMDVSAALSSASMDSTVLANSSFSEQAQYPAPSLSHSVLETSLTLNQPIMTPLEVPSAVSPNLGQISSLSSNYITSNLMTSKQKHLRPSMPLLTEEALANQARGESVFLLDSSNNIIPATSGSQISFQLTLDENNVIMSSGTNNTPTYQVVSGEVIASQFVTPSESHALQKVEGVSTEGNEKIKFESGENMAFSILPQTEQMTSEAAETVQHSIILREALEAPQTNVKNEHFLNNVEMTENDALINSNQVSEETDDKGKDQERIENPDCVDTHTEQINDSYERQEPLAAEEVLKHSLKRSLGEEQTVTSSSDLQDASKRIRIDER